MKKIYLFVILLLCSCQRIDVMKKIENIIFQEEAVYVVQEKMEVMNENGFNENDFMELTAFKTLLVYEQKEIIIMKDASEHAKKVLNEKKGYIEMIDGYVIYLSEENPSLTEKIKNEIHQK